MNESNDDKQMHKDDENVNLKFSTTNSNTLLNPSKKVNQPESIDWGSRNSNNHMMEVNDIDEEIDG